MATTNKAKTKSEFNVFTPIGITRFVHTFKPKAFRAGDDPQYRLILVFEPEFSYILSAKEREASVVAFDALRRAIKAAAVAKHGADYKEKGIKLRSPIRPGSDYSQYGAPFDVEGRVFITMNSNTQPGVVDRQSQPILSANDFYDGCLARASVYCHGYDTKGNKGVTLLLNNVQKTGDGERLGGGRRDAEDEFERLDPAGSGSMSDPDI